MTEHKINSGEKSVEQNLAKDYVSKSKLGNLPASDQISEAMKKKMNNTQKEIEKLKTEFLKKHKSLEAIGIIPAQAAKKIEEEYEISDIYMDRDLDSKKEVYYYFKGLGGIGQNLP